MRRALGESLHWGMCMCPAHVDADTRFALLFWQSHHSGVLDVQHVQQGMHMSAKHQQARSFCELPLTAMLGLSNTVRPLPPES